MGKTKISWATYTANVVSGCSKPAAFPPSAKEIIRRLYEELDSSDGKDAFARRYGFLLSALSGFPDQLGDPVAEALMAGFSRTFVVPEKWTKPGTSPECIRCYAEALSLRRGWSQCEWQEENEDNNVKLKPEKFREFGKIKVKPVDLPPSQRERFFVCSMGDIFHRAVPDEFLQSLFQVLRSLPHIYMLLTKRPDRAAAFQPRGGWPEHVWLGTTSGHPVTKWRIEYLRRSSAPVRFISMEPLLASMLPLNLDGIQQVIVGGESGKGFRPMKMEWAREVLDVCEHSNSAFFYKQDAAFRTETRPYLVSKDGRKLEYHQFPGEHTPARAIYGPETPDPWMIVE